MQDAKLIIAIMYNKEGVYKKCKKCLTKEFGEIEKESNEYDFDRFTNYYEREMGKDLVKRFISFKERINKNKLAEIKLKTAEIEKKFLSGNKRMINLDPGYLTDKELVLASFKRGTNYKQSIGEGVYAHKVLGFKGKETITFWHTFPDYKVKENQRWFLDLIS